VGAEERQELPGNDPLVLNVPFRWPVFLLSKRFSSSSSGVGTWAFSLRHGMPPRL